MVVVDRHATKLLLPDRLYLSTRSNFDRIFWVGGFCGLIAIMSLKRHMHSESTSFPFLPQSLWAMHCLIYILHSDQFSWQSIFSFFLVLSLKADANVPLRFLFFFYFSVAIKLLWLHAARPQMLSRLALYFDCTCSRSAIDSVRRPRLGASLSQEFLMARFVSAFTIAATGRQLYVF